MSPRLLRRRSALIGLPVDLLGRGEERPDRALQCDRDRLVVLLQAAPEQLGARRELEDLAGRGLLAGGDGVELPCRRVGAARVPADHVGWHGHVAPSSIEPSATVDPAVVKLGAGRTGSVTGRGTSGTDRAAIRPVRAGQPVAATRTVSPSPPPATPAGGASAGTIGPSPDGSRTPASAHRYAPDSTRCAAA